MKIAEANESQIRDVMSCVDCEKDFGCYESDFAEVCKVKNRGPEKFLECLEKNAQSCQFALSFGNVSSCLCPVRIYMATELNV
jgi:hypothetical protein